MNPRSHPPAHTRKEDGCPADAARVALNSKVVAVLARIRAARERAATSSPPATSANSGADSKTGEVAGSAAQPNGPKKS